MQLDETILKAGEVLLGKISSNLSNMKAVFIFALSSLWHVRNRGTQLLYSASEGSFLLICTVFL